MEDKLIFGLVFTVEKEAIEAAETVKKYEQLMLEVVDNKEEDFQFILHEIVPLNAKNALRFWTCLTVSESVREHPSYLNFRKKLTDNVEVYAAFLFREHQGVYYIPRGSGLLLQIQKYSLR